jgi:hypothetical protein
VLFRLASYLFVGVTAGYVTTIILYQVLWPRIVLPLVNGNLSEKILAVVPLLMGALLLFKLSPRLSPVGSIPMGYLVGIGAALAVGGAVFGTLFGQARAAMSGFDIQPAPGSAGVLQWVGALVMLVGTITTLVYFNFSVSAKRPGDAQRPAWLQALAGTGKIFIAITFGALFAGVFLASIAALADRLEFIRNVVEQLVAL